MGAGLKITGDDWERGDRVTGTEGTAGGTAQPDASRWTGKRDAGAAGAQAQRGGGDTGEQGDRGQRQHREGRDGDLLRGCPGLSPYG